MDDQLAADIASGAQPERTALAWSRTLVLIAALNGVIALNGLLTGESLARLAVPCAIGALALGGAPYLSHRRLRVIHADLVDGRSVVPLRALVVLTAFAIALSAFAMVVVLS